MDEDIFYRYMSFIKKTKPDYVYNENDFLLRSRNGVITVDYWNLDIGEPTKRQLDKIKKSEIDDQKKKKKVKTKIDKVEKFEDITEPEEGFIII